MDLKNHAVRTHAVISASSAYRWINCPPSAIAATLYPPQESPYAKEGTLAHEVAEAVTRGETLPENEKRDGLADGITSEMLECAKSYAAYIQELRTPGSAFLLEQRVDFSAWVPHGFGTADAIIVEPKKIIVVDYKYGSGVKVDACGNPQMSLYALGAYALLSDLYDFETVEMHIFQPRMDNISVHSLPVVELLKWGEEVVRPAASKAAKGDGEYKPGEHCRFCPHAGRCKALTDTCVEVANNHGLGVEVPVLSPAEVAEVLRLEPLVSLWLKSVKAQALQDLLNGESVPGFKVVEGKLGNREWSDDYKVIEALEEAGVAREDYLETKLRSPAAMDKAVGKKKVAELLGGLIKREPGAPALVPESDKRPPLNRLSEAQKDFE